MPDRFGGRDREQVTLLGRAHDQANDHEGRDDVGKLQHAKGRRYPSEDQHVICVGGTDLVTSGAGGAWSSESTWVDGGGGYYAYGPRGGISIGGIVLIILVVMLLTGRL